MTFGPYTFKNGKFFLPGIFSSPKLFPNFVLFFSTYVQTGHSSFVSISTNNYNERDPKLVNFLFILRPKNFNQISSFWLFSLFKIAFSLGILESWLLSVQFSGVFWCVSKFVWKRCWKIGFINVVTVSESLQEARSSL